MTQCYFLMEIEQIFIIRNISKNIQLKQLNIINVHYVATLFTILQIKNIYAIKNAVFHSKIFVYFVLHCFFISFLEFLFLIMQK